MLQIRLLGQFDVRLDGQPVHIPAQAAQSLLAYLVLNPGLPQRRERLAGLFWPDVAEASARGNLRHALWRVRKALGTCPATGRDYILADEFTVTFDPQADLWLDTRCLDTPPDPASALESLLTAAGVYRGELLPGFYDDWVTAERQRLQAAFESRMALLLEKLIEAGRWADVLDIAERWVALGGAPEPAYRALMQAHAAQGNQSQVAATFHRCYEALRQELGVAPSEQTRALFETLAHGLELSAPAAAEAAGFPTPPDLASADPANPYKGLRAFQEADGVDFFGRETLVDRLLARLSGPEATRFLAVVGPSGSGKSSVVRAGLLPALRRGALPGSEHWSHLEMLPGAYPLEELEAALLRIAVNPPESLMAQLREDGHGLMRAVKRALPDGDSELLILVDQFEELFTLTTDEAVRRHFLDSLVVAATDPHSRVRVVISLRADFYDRPLLVPDFCELMRLHTEVVVPLTLDELKRAIGAPAQRVGVKLEPGLMELILSDVREQAGALPMLEFSLTELFERREAGWLTRRAYAELGGVPGALAQRAEAVFAGLDEAGRTAAQQVFLRLVTLGEGVEDTRRRVLRSELTGLAAGCPPAAPGKPQRHPVAPVVDAVIDAYGRQRLLTFDRDRTSGQPTVEVAHEAVLREWPLLRRWLDESRADVRQERLLGTEAAQWCAAGREPSYLLSGARLEQFEGWAATSAVALTQDEWDYLDASLAERDRLLAERTARQARELALEKRARRVLRVLAGVFLAAALVAGGLAWWANSQRQAAVAAHQEAVANLAVSDAQRLAAEAKTLVLEGRDAPTAALLALRSITLHYTPQGDEALARALQLDYPLRAYSGHVSELDDAGFLPGNDIMFTTGSDITGSVRLWKVATGEIVGTFDVPNGCMESKLSPDGKLLAAACRDGLVHVWDLGTRQEVRRFDHQATVNPRVRFSPDGKQLLTAGVGTVAKLWDFGSGQLLREFVPTGTTQSATMGVAFTPDGKQIVTGGQDGALRLWDLASGSLVRQYTGHTDWAWGVDISPDGKYLVSSSLDSGGARLWDLATGQELRRFVQTGSMSFEVSFSPDGRYVLTGGWDNTVRLWDVQTGRELRRFTHSQPATGLAFSSDGRYVLTTAYDQVARLWEIQPSTGLPRYPIVEPPAYGVLSPDGRQLAVASGDHLVRLLDAKNGQELRRFVGHTGQIYDIAFSPNGQLLATTSSGDGSTRVWSTQSGDMLWMDPTSGGMSLGFSQDGQRLFVGGFGQAAGLYDAATGKLLQSFAYSDFLMYGAYAPDGTTVATALGTRADVLLWDAATGQILRTFHPDPGDTMRAITYSPDGKYLAAGGNTGTLYLWDVASGKEVRRFVGHNSNVERALAFSPDGRYLVSGGFDQTVRVWDIASGQELRRLAGYTDVVTKVAYTPDGQRLLIFNADGSVTMSYARLQDAVDDLCRRQLRDLLPVERTRYNITDAAPTCPGPASPTEAP
jgi:WD40 repeat protein/DNA-binding SARP family transcriptional activator